MEGDLFIYMIQTIIIQFQSTPSHGGRRAFRDTLGNFLMKRTFLGTPELSSSFLTIDPAQLSKVFSVTKVGDSPIYDHWYGYVHFDVTAKLPINRVAIPRLD